MGQSHWKKYSMLLAPLSAIKDLMDLMDLIHNELILNKKLEIHIKYEEIPHYTVIAPIFGTPPPIFSMDNIGKF